MLSIMPPVLPILKQPGLMPPTVAGPMMVMPFFLAMWAISLARCSGSLAPCHGQPAVCAYLTRSGTPSAMMAIVLTWRYSMSSRGRAVDAPRRGEVDHDVNVGVLGHGLGHLLVDGQQGLAGAPSTSC